MVLKSGLETLPEETRTEFTGLQYAFAPCLDLYFEDDNKMDEFIDKEIDRHSIEELKDHIQNRSEEMSKEVENIEKRKVELGDNRSQEELIQNVIDMLIYDKQMGLYIKLTERLIARNLF